MNIMCSEIPIFWTSKENDTWFEKSDSLRNQGKITVLNRGGEAPFGLSYQGVLLRVYYW